MKALIFNTAILILTLSVFTTFAQKEKEKIAEKEIHKEFQATQKTLLDINNKFGDIRIKDWDQNDIKIDVKVTVYDCNPEKAQRHLDRITINFSESENVIFAKTEIKDKSEGSFLDNISKDCSFQIDYEISIPRYLKMNLRNKFGNIHINEIHGKTDINLDFGDLRANKMMIEQSEGLSKINVDYGNVSIGSCTWLDLDLEFSDLDIDLATGLTIKAKYTEIEIDQCNVIKADVSFGEFKAEKANKIELYSGYSDVKIGRIESELMADLQFGDFHLKNTSKSFKSLNISGQYSDIKIGVEKGASYTLSAKSSYGSISLDDKSVQVEEKDFSQKAGGPVGSNAANSTLTVTSGFGDIKIYYPE